MSGECADGTEQLTHELVTTKEVTGEEDIRNLLQSLEVPIHNRWVDLRSKELGALDYEPVELVVSRASARTSCHSASTCFPDWL